jgi:iron complex outermembrane receptor protein
METVHIVARKLASAEGEALFSHNTPADPRDTATPPANIADLVGSQPGLSFTGQGGLFQTVSIRGLSRQRIGSFYLDIPLLTERRAGTAASFIDPTLIDRVTVVRGPATSQYGSGNMGGILLSQPRWTTGVAATLGWADGSEENLQHLAVGSDRLQAAISHRGADQGRTASGESLNSGFDQYNLALGARRPGENIDLRFDTLLSYGDDIGKSNNLFPDSRVTDYPRERHWLGQLTLEAPAWRGAAWYHYQDLTTRVVRLEQRRNEVDSESLDFGGNLFLTLPWQGLRLGLDYLARRGVEADESQRDFADGATRHWDILDADQDEVALVLDAATDFSRLTLAGGLRASYIDQRARRGPDESEGFFSGFAGVSWQATDQLTLSAELASGTRMPNLSERYFSGTTGRGEVRGNPDLDPETALNLELGGSWQNDRTRVELHAFYTDIDDFIERVQVTDNLLSFRNMGSGEIVGAEALLEHRLGDHWRMVLSGHLQEGEDNRGDTLADLSPARLGGRLYYDGGRWQGQLAYDYRFSHDDVANTETPVDAAGLLSARLSYRLREGLSLQLWGRNLLDDSYRVSTDDLATEGEERTIGILLRWERG